PRRLSHSVGCRLFPFLASLSPLDYLGYYHRHLRLSELQKVAGRLARPRSPVLSRYYHSPFGFLSLSGGLACRNTGWGYPNPRSTPQGRSEERRVGKV